MLKAFVAMPFHPDLDWVYELIEEVCKKNDVEPLRIDKIPGVVNIWSAIIKEIKKCDFFIGDLSRDPCFQNCELPLSALKNSCNSNVATEAGYAIAKKKHIIIISNMPESLPFDFQVIHALFYSSDPTRKSFFQKALENKIVAIKNEILRKPSRKKKSQEPEELAEQNELAEQEDQEEVPPEEEQTPQEIPGFTYLRSATYTCNGITNTVQEYQHERTGMEFVWIPGGTFSMGSDQSSLEQPVHQVTLSPFLMSKTQVTQKVWQAIMEVNPSYFKKGDDYPVENISWDKCKEFCDQVGLKLPTESQWEFACRAGSTTPYYFGEAASELGEYAWYKENSGRTTHPVAQKIPNAYGLYDMLGNVWEWCEDWFNVYPEQAVTDPVGQRDGFYRVNRGNSWDSDASDCRCSFRRKNGPTHRWGDGGFRLCL